MKMKFGLVLLLMLLLAGCQTGKGSVVENLSRPFKDLAGSSEEQEVRKSSSAAVDAKAAQLEPEVVFQGLKKIVAVSRFENRSSFASEGAAQLGMGMRDQLADALVQSGRFVVLERQNITDVLGEQKLAKSGLVSKSQSARSGKLTAAQFLVQGTITEFKVNAESGGSGFSFAGISLGGSSASTHIGAVIRIIDTTTGEVIASERTVGTAEGSSSSIGVDFGSVGFKTGSKKADPLDQAVQYLVDDAVQKIAAKLSCIPFKGRVIQIKGNSIIVSASQRNGAQIGDEFFVYSVGKELKDPFTGELLGREEVEVGRVKLLNVKERYSFAKRIGKFKLKPGDFIKGASES